MAYSPLITYQGCVSLYISLHTHVQIVHSSIYIRLALQSVSIMNFPLLFPHHHCFKITPKYSQATLYHNQVHLLLVSLLLETSIPSCPCATRSFAILLASTPASTSIFLKDLKELTKLTKPSVVAAAARLDLMSKLGKEGKLTAEERNHCPDNKLCMFCDLTGHIAKDCLKSTS